MSKATPPPNSREVKVGNATFYVRTEVEETYKRLEDAWGVEREKDEARAKRMRRLWLLAAIDVLIVLVAAGAFFLALETGELLAIGFTAGVLFVSAIYIAHGWLTIARSR